MWEVIRRAAEDGDSDTSRRELCKELGRGKAATMCTGKWNWWAGTRSLVEFSRRGLVWSDCRLSSPGTR